MNIGKEIRRARERAGLTQEDLAARVGVHARSIGNWERGAHPPRNRLAKVEAVLGLCFDANLPRIASPALRDASDAQLLTELANRLARTTVSTVGVTPSNDDVVPERASHPEDQAAIALKLAELAAENSPATSDRRAGS